MEITWVKKLVIIAPKKSVSPEPRHQPQGVVDLFLSWQVLAGGENKACSLSQVLFYF